MWLYNHILQFFIKLLFFSKKIECTLTQTPKCGKNWKENNKNYKYDLSKPEDVLKYVKACEAAHAIHPTCENMEDRKQKEIPSNCHDRIRYEFYVIFLYSLK